MKKVRKSTVVKGGVIPEGEDGFSVELVPENKSDEIQMLEDEARKTIASIIKKVEDVTGRDLREYGRTSD